MVERSNGLYYQKVRSEDTRGCAPMPERIRQCKLDLANIDQFRPTIELGKSMDC